MIFLPSTVHLTYLNKVTESAMPKKTTLELQLKNSSRVTSAGETRDISQPGLGSQLHRAHSKNYRKVLYFDL